MAWIWARLTNKQVGYWLVISLWKVETCVALVPLFTSDNYELINGQIHSWQSLWNISPSITGSFMIVEVASNQSYTIRQKQVGQIHYITIKEQILSD